MVRFSKINSRLSYFIIFSILKVKKRYYISNLYLWYITAYFINEKVVKVAFVKNEYNYLSQKIYFKTVIANQV